jgi:hypothetical protein
MKRTFLINDIFWMAIGLFFCIGGLRLGFGTFHKPHAGFMPFLSGLLLGLLAFLDLISGMLSRWDAEKEDRIIWAQISWPKVVLTVAVLFVYTIFFTTLGFLIGTFLLLFFLFQVMERRPWWITLAASAGTTALFYLIFKVGLESQLPQGFLGF